MKKTLAALAALALAALGVLMAPTAAFAAGGTVTITVSTQASAPISGAFVSLIQSNGSVTLQETATPGTYSLANMTPGTYKIFATATGYAGTYFGDTSVRANAADVVITDGGSTDLAMTMAPESTISGTITDHLGIGFATTVYLYSDNEGGQYVGQVPSNASGAYSFPGLGHGDYRVLVYTGSGSTEATQWYVDANTAAAATVIHLTSASATADLQLEQATHISGTVTNTRGTGLPLQIQAIPAGASQGTNVAFADSTGAYSVGGLLADDYTLATYDSNHIFVTQTSSVITTSVGTPAVRDFVMTPMLPTEAALVSTGSQVAALSGPTQVQAGHSYTWVVDNTDNNDVYVALYSTPSYLGAFDHDVSGTTATITVTVPADTPSGAHSLAYMSYTTGKQGFPAANWSYFPIQVSAAELAKTGTDSALPIGLGILLLVSGGGAAALARRRTVAPTS